MFILDTDVLSLVQRKTDREYDLLAQKLEIVARNDLVAVTIVSFEEQMRGWLFYLAKSRTVDEQVERYRKLRWFYDDFKSWRVLDFDDDAGRFFGLLRSHRVRVGTMDLKIAAIALRHGATLVTRNLSDFRKVPGLLVEDWTKPS